LPDFWTHIVAGEIIFDSLKDNSLKKILQQNRNYFIFGCQGPDFLFYNDFLPWIRIKRGPSIGQTMHKEKTRELFECGFDYLKKNIDTKDVDILISYFSGLVCHYVIDKTCHPFINDRSKNSDEHKVLEANIDVYLVGKYWYEEAFKLSPLVAMDIGYNINTTIENFYRDILYRVYNINGVDFINDSYRDMKRVMKLFYCPYFFKRMLLSILNLLIPQNILIYIYPKSVCHEVISENELVQFEEILFKGISEGLEHLKILEKYLKNPSGIAIEKDFYRVSFSGEKL